MAIIERVDINAMNRGGFSSEIEDASSLGLPGLRTMSRATTASLSDYPEWTMEELRHEHRDGIITDGSCS